MRYDILKIMVFPYTKGQGLTTDRKCMGITHETMKLSHYIRNKVQKPCALIFANALSSVCVCVCLCVCAWVGVCIQLNGIVLITYVDPTSLDYLLSPFNEDAVLSAFLEDMIR